jgi:NAD-dependent dihydropyrimidine dehydrogenase PreA subunit
VSDVITPGIYEIKVYKDLCKACGLCVAWCPKEVLAPDEENYPLTPGLDSCIGCKLCEWHCPDFAIEIIAPGTEVADVNALIHEWQPSNS